MRPIHAERQHARRQQRQPFSQRATVPSFDSLLGSGGAAGLQPVLGRVADVWGYPVSHLCSAGIQALALPFFWRARGERAASDVIDDPRELG